MKLKNLKVESKNMLSDCENKIDKSKKETQEIIKKAQNESEKIILERTKKFYELIDNKKKNTEQKINQMKENALKDIKNISIKISIEAVKHLIKNSIDKNKIEIIYTESLEQTIATLKNSRV